MTEETSNTSELDIEAYKSKADLLGIKYHPNIGAETLRNKITEHMAKIDQPAAPKSELVDEEPEFIEPVLQPAVPNLAPAAVESPVAASPVHVAKRIPVAETAREKAYRIKMEASALVRIRITCMNPHKREWEGEIFTVANKICNFKKFVPYNEVWHVPNMVLNMIQERQCQVFITTKGSRGFKSRTGKLIKEFGVEILPNLTKEELADLAQRQAMANGTQA